ncbi:hypothetical protein GGI21_004355, partial [Coemansia aciculifera]
MDSSLARLVVGDEHRGELRYEIWDLLDEYTPATIAHVVNVLKQIDIGSNDEEQCQRRRLAILNFIASALT